MSNKKEPNQAKYLQILRGMSPEKRLLKAFELSELARNLFAYGLRKTFPDLDAGEFNDVLLDLLGRCHNRNY